MAVFLILFYLPAITPVRFGAAVFRHGQARGALAAMVRGVRLRELTIDAEIGGGEYDTARKAENAPDGLPFAGVSVQPVGFPVVEENGVKMLPAQHLTTPERALNRAPQMIEDVKSLFSGRQGAPAPGKNER